MHLFNLKPFENRINTPKYIKNPCIYAIVNKINFKFYVGSANSIKKRICKHTEDLRLNKHDNKHLQSSVHKYGMKSFIVMILEECSKDNLLKREQYWMDALKSTNQEFGYNLSKIAGSRLGMSNSKLHNERISKANTGKIRNKEMKYRISLAAQNRNWFEESHPNVKTIEQLSLDGVLIKVWACGAKGIERRTGICAQNIRSCQYGIKKTAGGFKWRYRND